MPAYNTPGVYIEEISSGPRPVAPSSTTDTGFVAMVTLPRSVVPGRGGAEGMLLPGPDPTPVLAWNRALAFRSLGDGGAAALPGPTASDAGDDKKKPAAKAPAGPDNRFQAIVGEVLPGNWSMSSPATEPNSITMRSDAGGILRLPANRTLLSVKTAPDGSKAWDLSWGADEQKVVELISGRALAQEIGHKGDLPSVDAAGKPVNIDPDAIHSRMHGTAPAITNMTGYEQWRTEFGATLFQQILMEGNKKLNGTQTKMIWQTLPGPARAAWDRWVRTHPGIQRLELSLIGFFSNGGSTAYISCGIQAQGAGGPAKRAFLEKAFDGASAVAMVAAPGLDFSWQQAILEYAGPKGRGDIFAVMDTPRFLTTEPTTDVAVDDFRWNKGTAPYEMARLEFLPEASTGEMRFLGYSSDEVLDRSVPRDDAGFGASYGPWLIVENPMSTGAHDRYVVAPPSGYVVGLIAGTDLRAGGGVHKAPANEQMLGVADLVTNISDREQGPMNMKGLNVIRHRPGGGIRIWGARTTGADALWAYINVRRLFLFVERSVRDAVQWSVFLPNNTVTRMTLKETIASFLIRLYNEGMLDGATWQESFEVKCDSENNPDVDVRSGLLTVDVSIRPVYPAEFVRIRFQQAAMRVE